MRNNLIRLLVTSILCSLVLISTTAFGYTVSVKDGNIFVNDKSKTIQLTQDHINSSPIISPDQSFIAFIKRYPVSDYDPQDNPGKQQIWLYDIRSKAFKLLVKSNTPVQMKKLKLNQQIHAILEDSLQFTPDSKRLYFITQTWVVSGAVHAINIDGTNEQYVAPGNSLYVLPKGSYAGSLIINNHNYFIGGGSYDWYWLYKNNGEVIGPLGESVTDTQKEFLNIPLAVKLL